MKKLIFVLVIMMLSLIGCSSVKETVSKANKSTGTEEKVEKTVKEYVELSKDEKWDKMYSLIYDPKFTKEDWIESKEAEVFSTEYEIKSYKIMSVKKDGKKNYKVRVGMETTYKNGDMKGVIELAVVPKGDSYQIDLQKSKEVSSEKF
ncbi:hypothetical protein [Bacillus marasmi]|uniref:hypothetical protein n=1 Tax=Bacillus marasmi TaxID=1926279 RepID=UPI0011C9E597|nr:hypothetical protein [Bacillus marasmi]